MDKIIVLWCVSHIASPGFHTWAIRDNREALAPLWGALTSLLLAEVVNQFLCLHMVLRLSHIQQSKQEKLSNIPLFAQRLVSTILREITAKIRSPDFICKLGCLQLRSFVTTNNSRQSCGSFTHFVDLLQVQSVSQCRCVGEAGRSPSHTQTEAPVSMQSFWTDHVI